LLFPIRLAPFETLRDWECRRAVGVRLDIQHWTRLVSGSLPAPDQRPESVRH